MICWKGGGSVLRAGANAATPRVCHHIPSWSLGPKPCLFEAAVDSFPPKPAWRSKLFPALRSLCRGLVSHRCISPILTQLQHRLSNYHHLEIEQMRGGRDPGYQIQVPHFTEQDTGSAQLVRIARFPAAQLRNNRRWLYSQFLSFLLPLAASHVCVYQAVTSRSAPHTKPWTHLPGAKLVAQGTPSYNGQEIETFLVCSTSY